MRNNAEDRVSEFYNTVGWECKEGITYDARIFEDLREHAEEYVSKCRLRVLSHIPTSHIPTNGDYILDVGCGPIQYNEYLQYSRNFKKRYCVDLSSKALENAKEKIGDQGVFLHGSFLDIYMEEDFFDCAVSLHTIYHIDKDKQEEAVRKLIKVTKPGKPVIIVYSNPNTIVSSFLPLRMLRRIKRLLKRSDKMRKNENELSLYFHAHPIEWWNRFSDIASVKLLPQRSFDSSIQKRLIPNNKIGRKMFDVLFNLEQKYPDFFVKHFRYLIIILTKKEL